jgi:hypothetical protein
MAPERKEEAREVESQPGGAGSTRKKLTDGLGRESGRISRLPRSSSRARVVQTEEARRDLPHRNALRP